MDSNEVFQIEILTGPPCVFEIIWHFSDYNNKQWVNECAGNLKAQNEV
jgi:hypothetical protein